MGQGIDLAAGTNPELRAALENMRDQLLIALIRRHGGKLTVPVREIDNTGGFVMTMECDQSARTFTFELVKKQ